MNRHALTLAATLSVAAAAEPLTIKVGERAEVAGAREAKRLTVRDPSMLEVSISDSAVSLVGRLGGVTSISFRTADGHVHTELVIVEGPSAPGMRREGTRSYDIPSVASARRPAKALEARRARRAVSHVLEVSDAAAHSAL